MVVDVKRAHWNADARRVIYFQLPDEDYEEGMCGLALKAKVLNRYMRWPVGGGIEYEADPRHAQVIAKEFYLEGGQVSDQSHNEVRSARRW